MKRTRSVIRSAGTYTSIEGLSSTVRLPRLGKIRLGIRVKKAKPDNRCKHLPNEVCGYCTYPKDTEYFVVPPEVAAVVGDKPTSIEILLPCDDRNLFFPQSLKWYKGSKLICKGNMEVATRLNSETGEMSEMKCPCEEYGKGCSERASLMVILPDVSMGGVYQIDTGSINNIIEINSTLIWLRGMLGRVAFVPLTLKRVPTTIQATEDSGQSRAVSKALLKLVFSGNVKDAAALRQRDAIAIAGGNPMQAMLPPAPIDEGDDHTAGAVIEIEEEESQQEQTGPAPQVPPPENMASKGTETPKDYTPENDGRSDPFPEPPEEAFPDYRDAPPPKQEPEPEQKEEPKLSEEDGIAKLLRSATSKENLNSTWSECVVKSKTLPPIAKVRLQQVFLDRDKILKAGRR